MYTSSSLSPLSLSLSEVSVSDSSSSLPVKQSSFDSIQSCNVHFATSAENRCGWWWGCWCFFVTYRILHHRCLSFCRFHKLIWKLLPTEPQRHKFNVCTSGPPWSKRVNLRKPAVHAMLVLIALKVSSSYVLFCTVRIRQNWLSCLRFQTIVILYSGHDVFFGVFSD